MKIILKYGLAIISFIESWVFLIKKDDWFTIPNILSYVRILMIPLYVYLYVKADTLTEFYYAAGILVVSGLTDSLDGIVARKTGQITDLGKALDPLADKLTQIAVVGAMFIERPYVLPLLVLFIVKELFLLINNIILYRRNIKMDGAMWFGKAATAVFYICMFILVVFPYLNRADSMPLIVVTAVFQVISLVGYAHWFFEKYRNNTQKS